MRFLARYAMRGPYHAAALAAALLLGSLSIGLLIVPAGAVIALVTLRKGTSAGLRVLGAASAIAVAVRALLDGSPMPTLVLCLVVGLPAWLLAINLARTQRQSLPLLMVGALVVAYAAAIRAAVGDVEAFWTTRLTALFALLATDGGPQIGAEQVAAAAGMIHAATLIAMFCMLAGIILLARWWQAVLFNPGGFGAEFRVLRLPRQALVMATLCGVGVFVDRLGSGVSIPLAGDAFVVVVVLFAFQGLAVLHARARAISLATGWLAGVYVMLMITPQVVGPILATTGVADSVADFRRLGAGAGEGPD